MEPPSPRKRLVVLGVCAVVWFAFALAGVVAALIGHSLQLRLSGLGLFVAGAITILVLIREMRMRPPAP